MVILHFFNNRNYQGGKDIFLYKASIFDNKQHLSNIPPVIDHKVTQVPSTTIPRR